MTSQVHALSIAVLLEHTIAIADSAVDLLVPSVVSITAKGLHLIWLT
jgi:hypothetical protein